MTTLKFLRQREGISQADLARRLQISRSDLSRLENGWFRRVQPHVETALKEVFGPEWCFASLMEEPPTPRPNVG